jgi:NAD(P)-dependent dehydrogenase (short-subunit alcohol dehydrogenase family)
MKDSALRLQDKTVLLTGPFNGTTQAVLRTLTEFGCDVGFVCDQPGYAGKYVEGINEAREVHSEYGRAAHLNLPLNTDQQIQEATGRIVESLGRMDVLIDATPLAWSAQTQAEKTVALSLNLAEKIIPFFIPKQRGRVIYIFEDPSLAALHPLPAANGCREGLIAMMEALAKRYRGQNVTVNALSLGVTEDFLTKIYPKSPSMKKSLIELQEKSGQTLKMVEFHDIGLSTAYLSSALSASVTSQVLRLTHGAHLA